MGAGKGSTFLLAERRCIQAEIKALGSQLADPTDEYSALETMENRKRFNLCSNSVVVTNPLGQQKFARNSSSREARGSINLTLGSEASATRMMHASVVTYLVLLEDRLYVLFKGVCDKILHQQVNLLLVELSTSM